MKTLLTLSLILTTIFAQANDSWVGKTAPKFDLPDQNGVFHTLKEYKGQWLVLYFYPKDDTSGCTTEAINFTKDLDAIKKLGATVVGASLDDIESHKKFAEKYKIPFTLLADKDEIMAKAYGVIGSMPFMRYAKRQTFIINPESKVAKFYEDVTASDHSQQVIKDLTLLTKSQKKEISSDGFEES